MSWVWGSLVDFVRAIDCGRRTRREGCVCVVKEIKGNVVGIYDDENGLGWIVSGRYRNEKTESCGVCKKDY